MSLRLNIPMFKEKEQKKKKKEHKKNRGIRNRSIEQLLVTMERKKKRLKITKKNPNMNLKQRLLMDNQIQIHIRLLIKIRTKMKVELLKQVFQVRKLPIKIMKPARFTKRMFKSNKMMIHMTHRMVRNTKMMRMEREKKREKEDNLKKVLKGENQAKEMNMKAMKEDITIVEKEEKEKVMVH